MAFYFKDNGNHKLSHRHAISIDIGDLRQIFSMPIEARIHRRADAYIGRKSIDYERYVIANVDHRCIFCSIASLIELRRKR